MKGGSHWRSRVGRLGIEDVVNITNIWRSGDIDVVELKKDLVKSTKVRRNWQLHPRICKFFYYPSTSTSTHDEGADEEGKADKGVP